MTRKCLKRGERASLLLGESKSSSFFSDLFSKSTKKPVYGQFVNEKRFPSLGDGVSLELKDVELPVRNIVSAIGFESWEDGRGVNQAGGTEATSAESLRRYATMDPSTPRCLRVRRKR